MDIGYSVGDIVGLEGVLLGAFVGAVVGLEEGVKL